jgi:hypothetical protein
MGKPIPFCVYNKGMILGLINTYNVEEYVLTLSINCRLKKIISLMNRPMKSK